ncbi:MAG: hypothetical protein JSV20_09355 [Candidatus Bathyarchaeota archaeon]|nr:MAG: hypothetical protein JSV20_09355 [Candidatus Bathyarchaeota archaeon]
MALAYTPGLKRKEMYIVRKTRRLPIQGEVLVKEGDKVDHNTILATTQAPGRVETVNAAERLLLVPDPNTHSVELKKYMFKKEGDPVKKGEQIALKKELFGLFKRTITSPIDGKLEYISNMSGQIILREPPIKIDLDSYIPGTIVKILSKEGAIIECVGAFIQGIFGLGGETHGELMKAVNSPDEVLTAEHVSHECKGKILIGGSLATEAAIRKAMEVGAKGIVVGGIEESVLTKILGFRVGVAITGHEDIPLTLIVTEGFSKMSISDKTFQLLTKSEGQLACLNGATQIRAGVIRPEIIIPRDDVPTSKAIDKGEEQLSKGMESGLPIRIIREPYFGALGHVVSLPIELQIVETESKVRILEAKLDDGRKVIVPRANVELIEE